MEEDSYYTAVGDFNTIRIEDKWNSSIIENYLTTIKSVKEAYGDSTHVEEFSEEIFETFDEPLLFVVTEPQVLLKETDEKKDEFEISNLKEEEEEKIIVIEPEKKYKIITDEQSVIKFPNNFCTDDHDLKHLTDIMNEDLSLWIKVNDEKGIRTFKKKTPEHPIVMVKTFAEIEGYTMDQIFDALGNFEVRKQWDKVLTEFKVLEKNSDDNSEILYSAIKPPVFIISKRDFVQKRKIWKGVSCPDSVIVHVKSCEHSLYPEKSSPVRGQIMLSGTYLKTLSENPLKVFLCTVAHNDIKGSISVSMINEMFPKSAKENILKLIEGLKKIHKK